MIQAILTALDLVLWFLGFLTLAAICAVALFVMFGPKSPKSKDNDSAAQRAEAQILRTVSTALASGKFDAQLERANSRNARRKQH